MVYIYYIYIWYSLSARVAAANKAYYRMKVVMKMDSGVSKRLQRD